jgi:hypothetical protein
VSEFPEFIDGSPTRKQKLKLVRQFTGGHQGMFGEPAGYNSRTNNLDRLTTKQWRKIDKYYEWIAPHARYEYKIVKPTRRDDLKAAAEYAGQKLLPGMRAVAIPVADAKHKNKIVIRKDKAKREDKVRVIDRTMHASIFDVMFDPAEFAKNPNRVINRIFKDYPAATFFIPISNQWTLFRSGAARPFLKEAMARFIFKYYSGSDKKDFIRGFKLFTAEYAGKAYSDNRHNESERREHAYRKENARIRKAAYRARKTYAGAKGRE